MEKKFVKVADIKIPVNCLHYKTIYVKSKDKSKHGYLFVPCNKCYKCRKRIASEWAFRLEQHSKDNFAYNMLFTYDDEHLPHYRFAKDEVACLNRVHLQDAFKRLRYYLHYHLKVNVQFFAVGEYGAKTKRPHYHAILFSPIDLCSESLEYLREVLKENVWSYGYSNITTFKGSASIGKMCGYMVTYMLTTLKDFYNNPFIRPFRYMSKNLGKHIVNEAKIIDQCRKTGNWSYNITNKDGEVVPVPYPRYYLKRWLNDEEKFNRFYEYLENCNNYNHYITDYYEKLSKRCGKNSSSYRRQTLEYRIAALQRREELYELDNYRKRKVHEHN